MYTLAIDVMGSDLAPKTELDAIKIVLKKTKNLSFIIFGEEEKLQGVMIDDDRLTYQFCGPSITGNDDAATAFRTKKDSSMVQAIHAVREGRADAVVSSGNTGAYIASALFILKRVKGVLRPSLTTLFPTIVSGKKIIVGDLGAVSDATAENILQNGILANEVAKIMLGIAQPQVALLNIGTEAKKGSIPYVEAYQLLKEHKNLNFVGNIEARNLLNGTVDVVVSDGFSGNIALKSFEGMQQVFSKLLKEGIMSSWRTKFGGLLLKPVLKGFKKTLDYESIGGAVLAGVKAPVIKAHGTTSVTQFTSAILLAETFLDHELVQNIERAVESMN